MEKNELNSSWPESFQGCNKLPGIPNIGNTCFANSCMQILNHTPAFINYFRNLTCNCEELKTQCKDEKDCDVMTVEENDTEQYSNKESQVDTLTVEGSDTKEVQVLDTIKIKRTSTKPREEADNESAENTETKPVEKPDSMLSDESGTKEVDKQGTKKVEESKAYPVEEPDTVSIDKHVTKKVKELDTMLLDEPVTKNVEQPDPKQVEKSVTMLLDESDNKPVEGPKTMLLDEKHAKRVAEPETKPAEESETKPAEESEIMPLDDYIEIPDYLLDEEPVTNKNPSVEPPAEAEKIECYNCLMADYVKQLETCQQNRTDISSGKFFNAVMKFTKNIKIGEMGDPEELLMHLENKLEDQNKNSIIRDIFYSKLVDVYTCAHCGNELRQSRTQHVILPKGDVTENLSNLTRDTPCDDQRTCNSCQVKRDTTEKTVFESTPPVLSIRINIKRDSLWQRDASTTEFPKAINLRSHMDNKEGPPVVYQLYAVVILSGYHYYAHCKAPSGLWTTCDDGHVTQKPMIDILKSDPFSLYYARREELDDMWERIEANNNRTRSKLRAMREEEAKNRLQMDHGYENKRDHVKNPYNFIHKRSRKRPEYSPDFNDCFQISDDEDHFDSTSQEKSIIRSENKKLLQYIMKKKAGSETEDEKADDKQTDGGIQKTLDRHREEKEKIVNTSLDAFYEQLRKQFPKVYNNQENRGVKEESSSDDLNSVHSIKDLSDDSE